MIFNPITIRLAELTVPAGPNDFGVLSTAWPPAHEVGVYGRPRWRIRPPLAPDDGWELDTLVRGDLTAERPVPEDVEWAYLTWAEGTRAEGGAGVLAALPSGRYLLARSSLTPRRSATVLLGNEHVPSPANIHELLFTRPHYAAVVGADGDRPPSTTHPLVGLVALNYAGATSPHGVLFFDCRGGQGQATGDLVLVVPMTGELVIDALAQYSDDSSARDAWRDSGARRLADALTALHGV